MHIEGRSLSLFLIINVLCVLFKTSFPVSHEDIVLYFLLKV